MFETDRCFSDHWTLDLSFNITCKKNKNKNTNFDSPHSQIIMISQILYEMMDAQGSVKNCLL